MRMGRSARTLAVTAVVMEVALTAPASAQEPGVIRDPDSPAGKEYALPFDAARRAGAGPDAPKEQGVAPLFGIGIRPPGSGPRGGSGAGDSNARRGDGAAGSGRGAGGRDERAEQRPNLPSAGELDGGDTSSVTLTILAAVLLGGGLLGVALRAGSRPRSGTA